MRNITTLAQLLLFVLALIFGFLGFNITPSNQTVKNFKQSTSLQEIEKITTTKTSNILNDKEKSSSKTDEVQTITKKEVPKETDSIELTKLRYSTGYNYFILSAILLIVGALLPRLEDISLPGGASLKLSRDVEAVKEQVNQIQENSIKVGGKLNEEGINEDLKTRFTEGKITKNQQYPEDPQKGLWGGKSKLKGRKLEAEVERVGDTDLYNVLLKITSTGLRRQLSGTVQFHLHDTFANPNPIVRVEDGVAELKLVAWGAFTVGAETDNGETKLELDLAQLENAPEEFKLK